MLPSLPWYTVIPHMKESALIQCVMVLSCCLRIKPCKYWQKIRNSALQQNNHSPQSLRTEGCIIARTHSMLFLVNTYWNLKHWSWKETTGVDVAILEYAWKVEPCHLEQHPKIVLPLVSFSPPSISVIMPMLTHFIIPTGQIRPLGHKMCLLHCVWKPV